MKFWVIRHTIRKFASSVRVAWCSLMARTFGVYVHSGWDGVNEYSQYRWRDQEWRIPTFMFYEPLTSCAGGKDGECYDPRCPQNREGEPAKTGRHAR